MNEPLPEGRVHCADPRQGASSHYSGAGKLISMKSKLLYLFAAALLVAGFVSLCMGWHGTMQMTASSPLSGSTFKFCGEANGWSAIAGLLCAVAAVIVFLIALIRTVINVGGAGHPPPPNASI